MKGHGLDESKNIIAEEIDLTSSRKRTPDTHSEWVTASSLRVKPKAASEISHKEQSGKVQKTYPSSDGLFADAEFTETKKRDVLSEFSRYDGYKKSDRPSFNSIDAQDTEMMTAAHRRVSLQDIQRRAMANSYAQSKNEDPARVRADQINAQRARAQAEAMARQRQSQMQTRQTQNQPKSIQRKLSPTGNIERTVANAPNTSDRRTQGGEWVNAKTTQANDRCTSRGEWTSAKSTQANDRRTQRGEWTSVKAINSGSRATRPSPDRAKSDARGSQRDARETKNNNTPPMRPRKKILESIEAQEVVIRVKERAHNRPSPLTGIFLLLCAILCILSIWLCVRMSTKITDIDIKSDDTANLNQAIKEACEDSLGKPYVSLDKAELEKRIFAVSPIIADVEIFGIYPRTLGLSVDYDTQRFYTVDENGFTYVTNSALKVLHIYEPDASFDDSHLTKLALPSFKAEKTGQTLEFATNASYIKTVVKTLSDFRGLGEISYISFINTQRIYFIFEGNFRCDLGDSSECELKLKVAEKTYKDSVLPALSASTDRTAIINVSVPSSATYRLDAELGAVE